MFISGQCIDGIENKTGSPITIGDKSRSDLVVRLRTQGGRDEWLYCHSQILVERSKYFADRLSENWPTCQILDSRSRVEFHCQDIDFDHHVNFLRLLYVTLDCSLDSMWHSVKNALGILRVAIELGCPHIISACVNYLEAVPWEEAEEEDILKIIPGMGSEVEPILARLQPVNSSAITAIFLSTAQFATSSPPLNMNDFKSSAQEQLEYMLTEDDDAPLLIADNEIKSQVTRRMKRLFGKFNNLVEELLCEESLSGSGKVQLFLSHLSDLSWACQILNKLDIVKEFVCNWVESSDKIVKVVEQANSTSEIINTRLKVIEVAAKVLEAISSDDDQPVKVDSEIWQSLESTFVSMILALPSGDQAEIVNEWLQNEHVRYPDLTEAFVVWCYRSKVAKRRLSVVTGDYGTRTNTLIFVVKAFHVLLVGF